MIVLTVCYNSPSVELLRSDAAALLPPSTSFLPRAPHTDCPTVTWCVMGVPQPVWGVSCVSSPDQTDQVQRLHTQSGLHLRQFCSLLFCLFFLTPLTREKRYKSLFYKSAWLVGVLHRVWTVGWLYYVHWMPVLSDHNTENEA